MKNPGYNRRPGPAPGPRPRPAPRPRPSTGGSLFDNLNLGNIFGGGGVRNTYDNNRGSGILGGGIRSNIGGLLRNVAG